MVNVAALQDAVASIFGQVDIELQNQAVALGALLGNVDDLDVRVAALEAFPPGTHLGSGGGSSLYLNVQDFGAVGDGVVDDTGAFEAAITIAGVGGVQGGGTIHVPPGVYVISRTLLLDRGNITIQGEFGATVLHQKANTPLPSGIIEVRGVPVFFRLKDLILSGNRVQQGGDLTSKGLNVHPLATSSGFNGASKVPNPNFQINDSCGRIENVLCINIAGTGIVATGSGCHWFNVEARACSGLGIDAGQNDAVWIGCSAGATDKEAWACWGGSARYYGCKGWWCGLGFNPATGTYGAYNRGGAFRIVNGNQLFSGCEGQESDGPAFMVQAPNITLSGCQATQACNLKGASTAIGQSPVRGGGYSVTPRTAVWLSSAATSCHVDVLVRDKFVGTIGTPNLSSFVLQQGVRNIVQVVGDPAIRSAGAPAVAGTLTGNIIHSI